MSLTPGSVPQFGVAEYSGDPNIDHCKLCGAAVGDEYYRVQNLMACRSCGQNALLTLPEQSHAAFVRGILFGMGGAFLGMVLYSTVFIVLGVQLGYVSLAVGYIVAAAMMKGSGGRGGRRYQIAAVALTYLAVSFSTTVVVVYRVVKKNQHRTVASRLQRTTLSAAPVAKATPGTPAATPVKIPTRGSLLKGFGMLLLIAFAAPLLALKSPGSGILLLFILAIGLRIAWRNTAGVTVDIAGPYPNKPSATGATA